MKLADVSSIFKKDDFKGKYRPVSALSTVSKRFERIMLSLINKYMTNKLFRKKMSSQNSLLYLIEKIKKISKG